MTPPQTALQWAKDALRNESDDFPTLSRNTLTALVLTVDAARVVLAAQDEHIAAVERANQLWGSSLTEGAERKVDSTRETLLSAMRELRAALRAATASGEASDA